MQQVCSSNAACCCCTGYQRFLIIKFFFNTKNYIWIPNFSSMQPEFMVLLNMLHYAASMQLYAANGLFSIQAHIMIVLLNPKDPYTQIFLQGSEFAVSISYHNLINFTNSCVLCGYQHDCLFSQNFPFQ